MKNNLIRFMIKGGTFFIAYQCFTAIRKQKVVRQASAIRQQRTRYGSSFQLSETKQKTLDEADQYLRNHAGLQYLNRAKPRQYLEQRIKTLLGQKQLQLTNLKDKQQNDPQILQIKKQLEQLNVMYQQVRPKYTTIQEMAEPDIEVDKDKYHKRV